MQNYANQLGSVFEEVKEKGLEEIIKICGVEEITRFKFLEYVMKFGISPFRVEDVYKGFVSFSNFLINVLDLLQTLIKYQE